MIPDKLPFGILANRRRVNLHRNAGACRLEYLCLFFRFIAGAGFAIASDSPRERISINDNWRFAKGDPTNQTVSLLYDVRQPQNLRRAEAEADGNPTVNDATANESTHPPPVVIKQWILPTGNELIKDASRRFVRPPANPGDGIAYVQPGF